MVENFAQLLARPSQSRFSRRNLSEVVPQLAKALVKVIAEW